MKYMCVLAICVLLSSLAVPQNSASAADSKTKYGAASRVSISGVVEESEQRSLGGACKAPGIFLILKANGQNYVVEVGPKWFLDDLSWTFNKGDKLDITGWKVEDGSEVVVRKLTRAEWILEPRDDSGAANWLWMPAPKDSGKCT